MNGAVPARGWVGWVAKGAVLLAAAGAVLGGIALRPAPSERELEISRTFAPKAVSRLVAVMREMDSICDEIGKLLRDGADLELARPVIEVHGRTLAVLAKETRLMTEGTAKTDQPVGDWLRLADASVVSGEKLSEAAAGAKSGMEQLREAEGNVRRRCVECHNLFVP